MAKKKRTRRRRAPLAAKRTKRRKSKSRGFLNDIMNPTIAMKSAKEVAMGAGGGVAAILTHKLLPATTGKFFKVLIAGVGGFGASVFGLPAVGAGYTGGLIALTFQNGLLGDDMEENDYANQNALSEMPLYLDEGGEPFVIEEGEDGEAYKRYLSDEEAAMIPELSVIRSAS